MEALKEFICSHAAQAHWYLLGAILLAGFNVPISADVLVLLAAVLAATVIPEHTVLLFVTLWVGCYVSALISYTVGRVLGQRLSTFRWFNAILPKERLESMKKSYDRYGLWVLLVGRFIPFGVRNCMFMSAGMSRMNLKKFMAVDALACSVWYTSLFSFFFMCGKNVDFLLGQLKTVNFLLGAVFGVTVIAYIWYKRKKKRKVSST